MEDTQFRVLYNDAPKTLSLIHTDIVFDRVIYWQSFIVCYNSVFIRERYFLNFCAVKTFENRINLIVLIANDCKLKYSKTTFCYDFYTTYTGISNSQLQKYKSDFVRWLYVYTKITFDKYLFDQCGDLLAYLANKTKIFYLIYICTKFRDTCHCHLMFIHIFEHGMMVYKAY